MNEIVESTRDNNRKLLKYIRSYQRELKYDSIRSCENFEGNVSLIANKLKTKAAINPYELKQLRNMLLEEENVKALMQVNGALRGIIRELIGLDAEKQNEAVACLCNITAACQKSAIAVAKNAGSYLVLYLENMNNEFVNNCLYTIGNSISWGQTTSHIFNDLGLLPKIQKLCVDVRYDLLDALCYVVITCLLNNNVGNSDILVDVGSRLVSMYVGNLSAVSYLLFLLSCQPNYSFSNITVETIDKIISILKQHEHGYSENEVYLPAPVSFLRFLANFCCNSINGTLVLKLILRESLLPTLIRISKTFDIEDTLFWLFGNIYSYSELDIEKETFLKELSVSMV